MANNPGEKVLQMLTIQNDLLKRILKVLTEEQSQKQMVTTVEAAKILGITPSHVRYLIRNGKINAGKLGTGVKQSRYLVDINEIKNFVDQLNSYGGKGL